MRSRRCPVNHYAMLICIVLGSAVCAMSPDANAGGVYLGFGVDVPPPYVVERTPPPVVVERPAVPPPLVMDRAPEPSPMVLGPPPVPPAVIVERTAPPPVVFERRGPDVVYEGPVLVERRSSAYYYPGYQYHSYHVETQRQCYRRQSREWEEEY